MDSTQWYVAVDGKAVGPVSTDLLRRGLEQGKVPVRRTGLRGRRRRVAGRHPSCSFQLRTVWGRPSGVCSRIREGCQHRGPSGPLRRRQGGGAFHRAEWSERLRVRRPRRRGDPRGGNASAVPGALRHASQVGATTGWHPRGPGAGRRSGRRHRLRHLRRRDQAPLLQLGPTRFRRTSSRASRSSCRTKRC